MLNKQSKMKLKMKLLRIFVRRLRKRNLKSPKRIASNLEIKSYKITKLKVLKQNKTNNDAKWIRNEMSSKIRFFF